MVELAATVRIEVPEPTIDVTLNVAVRPAGAEAVSAIVPAKPFRAVIVIVDG
jgi:hypothetical protein